jgi:uncharacterized OsmC-like protein
VSFKTIINGIDVGRQREGAAAPAVRDHATAATEWLGGTQTRTWVTTAARRVPSPEFTIDADYPDALLGSDRAPSPSELFLAALGSSFVTSFVLAAAAADVRIEHMRVLATPATADGSDEDSEARPGHVELRGEVDTDASRARINQLVAIAMEHSSVRALGGLHVSATVARVRRRSTK